MEKTSVNATRNRDEKGARDEKDRALKFQFCFYCIVTPN